MLPIFTISMENLPEALNFEIIKRLTLSDRNSVSLVSKQLYKIEADQRLSIRVGCRLNPATEALTSLCIRFSNLTKIEINYYGWESYLGKQLDDQGLFILSINCPSLTNLILCHCSFITDSGLSHLTSCKKLVNLSIVDCRVIKEHSLIVLGKGLRRLKRLELNLGPLGWHPKKPLVAESRFRHQICCKRLKELSFANCSFQPERGSSLILESCSSLDKVFLDSCIGLVDSDIISLSKKSPGLKIISLKSCSSLTDASLKALGSNCPFLENVELAFPNSKYWTPLLITDTILALVNGCSIRAMVLKDARFLNDSAMKTLSLASPCLETLELERAHKVTNLGIGHVIKFPRLVNLKITECDQITDDGLKPLVETKKLVYLMIKNCPCISEQGAQQAAKHVCYEHV